MDVMQLWLKGATWAVGFGVSFFMLMKFLQAPLARRIDSLEYAQRGNLTKTECSNCSTTEMTHSLEKWLERIEGKIDRLWERGVNGD